VNVQLVKQNGGHHGNLDWFWQRQQETWRLLRLEEGNVAGTQERWLLTVG
jgi:hypothetical protein